MSKFNALCLALFVLTLALMSGARRVHAKDVDTLHCSVTITLACNADGSVCTQKTFTVCTH